MTRALTWLAAYAILALLLGLLAKALLSTIDRALEPFAPPPPIVDTSARERGGTIICTPTVGPKLGARPTPREIV